MTKSQLYTANQIFIASFIGGPVASLVTLRRNFINLNNESYAKGTVIWGILLIVAMFVIVLLLPKNFPNIAIPAAYSSMASAVAQRFQHPNNVISRSEQFERRSHWRVLGLSLMCFVGSGMLIFIGAFLWVAAERIIR